MTGTIRRTGRNVILALAILGTGVMLTGCGSTNAQRKGGGGALLGAVAGAIIGHQSGETGEGAAIGAAIGGGAGYIIGNEEDKQRNYGDPNYDY